MGDPQNPSSTFRAFARSVESPPRSRAEHECYDLASLSGLLGAERLRAEAMLVDVLGRDKPDVRAVDALRVLGTSSALQAIEEALPHLLDRGHTGVALMAVDVLNEKDRVSKKDLVDVATRALQHGAIHHQTQAARLLARAGGKHAWRLMLDVIATMPLAFVRAQLYAHCLDALDVEGIDRDLPGNLAKLGQLIGGNSRVARDAGLAAFAPIAEHLSEGVGGAKAGVRRGKGKRAVRAARDALRTGKPVDFGALSESGRDYLGAWVLGQLPVNVPAYYIALERLKPALAGPVLEELSGWSDDELGGSRALVAAAREAAVSSTPR